MKAIATNDLTRRFGDRTAVDKLCLDVDEGELYALLGVNGAGKTTTIRMLSCVLAPTSGDGTILGHSITNDAETVKRLINVSPQETAVAPNLTLRENLELIARIYGASRSEARTKANDMLETFGLTARASDRAKNMSGGLQRRLSIAMALITGPRLLFLDEPTLGLDVLARRELWHAIEKLKGKVTVILTTHYMEEAEALADRVGVMVSGRLTAVGTPAELIGRTGAKNFEEAFIALAAPQEGGWSE